MDGARGDRQVAQQGPHGRALVVTLSPPPCRYLGFSIGHLRWYANLDYDNRQTSLNTVQARVSSDGVYRDVISAVDPGVANWIDTGGRREGFMFFRCQGLLGESLGQPTAALTPVNLVREAFSADEPHVTANQRLASLMARRLAVQHHHAY